MNSLVICVVYTIITNIRAHHKLMIYKYGKTNIMCIDCSPLSEYKVDSSRFILLQNVKTRTDLKKYITISDGKATGF